MVQQINIEQADIYNIDSIQNQITRLTRTLKKEYIVVVSNIQIIAKHKDQLNVEDIFQQIIQTKFIINPDNKDKESITKGQVYFY